MGTGTVLRPVHSVKVKLPTLALYPARYHVDRSMSASLGNRVALAIPFLGEERMAHTRNGHGAIFLVFGNFLQYSRHIFVVVFNSLLVLFGTLSQRAKSLSTRNSQVVLNREPIVERLKEIHGNCHVFDGFLSEQTFPQIGAVGFGAGFKGKVCLLESQLLNLFHSVLNLRFVVLGVHNVEEQGSISHYFYFGVGLFFYIIAPQKG